MKKIISIMAITILFFGCVKEETAQIIKPNPTPDTVRYTYVIKATCSSANLLVTTKYSPNDKESLLVMDGKTYTNSWSQIGKKWIYLRAKNNVTTSSGQVQLTLTKNGTVIYNFTCFGGGCSCIIDGTY